MRRHPHLLTLQRSKPSFALLFLRPSWSSLVPGTRVHAAAVEYLFAFTCGKSKLCGLQPSMIAASRLRPWPVPSTGQPFRGSREPCEPYGAAASAAYGASSKRWIAWCAAAGGLARGGLPRAVATAARPAEAEGKLEAVALMAGRSSQAPPPVDIRTWSFSVHLIRGQLTRVPRCHDPLPYLMRAELTLPLASMKTIVEDQ